MLDFLPGDVLAALTPLSIAVTLAAFFIAGSFKGVAGLGLPLVSLAIMVLVIEFKTAVALMTLPLILTNIVQALSGGHLLAMVKRHWRFLALAFITTFVIQRLSQGWDERWLVVGLGLITMLYTSSALVKGGFAISPPAERWLALPMALVSGFFSGISGAFSLPAALYFQALGLGKNELVQTLGIWFLTGSLALTLGVAQGPQATGANWLLSAIAAIPAFAGMWLGQKIRTHLSETRFRTILLASLCVIGTWLVIRGLILW